MEPPKLINVFLISMSFTYLWAFASLYFQVEGLYGDKGLMPVRSILKCESKDARWCAVTGSRPTVLHLFVHYGLSPSQALELVCVIGIALSVLSAIFRSFRDCIVYGSLWYLYFSCFQVGQTFLWFQWDTLLLETGFLVFFLAPFRFFRRLLLGADQSLFLPQDNVGLFLIRWLAFRLLYASGIVKLTSECPTWWGLTALHYHFESQCIPTWPAWYAHVYSPDWFKQLSVIATYVIEIFIPIAFFFAPVWRLRQFAFYSEVLLMVNIMITGNYNFFNAITIVICLPMLVNMDGYSSFGVHRFKQVVGRWCYEGTKQLLILLGFAAMIYWSYIWFAFPDFPHSLRSTMAISKRQFLKALSGSMPIVIIFGSVMILLEVFAAIVRCFTDGHVVNTSKGYLRRSFTVISCVITCILAIILFSITLVPLSWLSSDSHHIVSSRIRTLHDQSDKYQLTHSYGLFRHMTGIGGRPEVIIEGAQRESGPWEEYEFLYKPGKLNVSPSFIIPHQARLDWQMWFAALDSYQRNPWLISLMHRLLTNETSVLKLMDPTHLPFNGKVRYVRAKLYHYHFTTATETDKNYHATNWWWREFKSEYFPMISLDSELYVEYLRNSGLLLENVQREKPNVVSYILSQLRAFIEGFQTAERLIWALTIAALIVLVVKRRPAAPVAPKKLHIKKKQAAKK